MIANLLFALAMALWGAAIALRCAPLLRTAAERAKKRLPRWGVVAVFGVWAVLYGGGKREETAAWRLAASFAIVGTDLGASFSISTNGPPLGFYRLGTRVDTDGDGANDAFEVIAALSDPVSANAEFAVLADDGNAINNQPYAQENWMP